MHRIANASALGYGAFALTLWLASMASAGWFAVSGNIVLTSVVAVLGGGVLALAGILQSLRGQLLDSALFLGFAAYWWVAALTAHMLADGASAPSAAFLGWYYLVWAILAACLWVGAWRDGSARMLFTLGLWLSLFAFALANWIHIEALTMLGGYLGLVSAVIAIYIAAAEIINALHGQLVLPLGERAGEQPLDTPIDRRG